MINAEKEFDGYLQQGNAYQQKGDLTTALESYFKASKLAKEKELTTEEAVEEYNKSEKGLRYQLIQEKILKDNDIKIDYAELKEFAKGFIRAQMAQFGNMNPEDKELEDIAGRILANQDEAKRLQDQLISQKLLTFYKENMSFKNKEVTYENFVKEVYQ